MTQKINLFLDAFVIRFPRTGIVNYVYSLISGHKNNKNIDLTLLTHDDAVVDNSIREEIINLRRINVVDSGLMKYIRVLRKKTIDREHTIDLPLRISLENSTRGADVFHGTDWFYYPVKNAKKNVITVHDATAIKFPQFHEKTNIDKEKIKFKNLKYFDKIVAVSESTKSDIIEIANVDPSKIVTSYQSVDPIYEIINNAIDNQIPNQSLEKLRGRRYFLSVSTIEPRKNILGLLESFKIFCDSSNHNKDILLAMSGMMGWSNSELKLYLDNYPYIDRILFLGYVPLSDMPLLYKNCTAFLYLSFYEGFGIPILEAMKSSAPVICSNVSSMPEVIGRAGIQVSPYNYDEIAAAMTLLANNDSMQKMLGQNGFERSRFFTWEKHLSDLFKIYGES